MVVENVWRKTGFNDSSFRVDPRTNLRTNVVPWFKSDVIQTNWKSRLGDHVHFIEVTTQQRSKLQ